jgi:hypothetical protein
MVIETLGFSPDPRHPRRLQAENLLIPLSEFPRPPLNVFRSRQSERPGKISEMRSSIGRHLCCNRGRQHSSLDRQAPDQAYFGNVPLAVAG